MATWVEYNGKANINFLIIDEKKQIHKFFFIIKKISIVIVRIKYSDKGRSSSEMPRY